MKPLTPEQVRQIRKDAGLTQTQAAALGCRSLRTWQEIEAGDRAINPAVQELFLAKIKALPKPKS